MNTTKTILLCITIIFTVSVGCNSVTELPEGCPPDCTSLNLDTRGFVAPDLSGANLANADFRGANLGLPPFGGPLLPQPNLSNVNFQGSNLQGVNLGRSNLRGANLLILTFSLVLHIYTYNTNFP